MKRPAAVVLAVSACAAAILSGCANHAGVAAAVAGHTISERQVDSYLTGRTPDASAAGQTDGSPRSMALGQIVQANVFEQALAKTQGGLPSDAQLAAAHDDALQLFGESVTGTDYDAALLSSVQKFGLNTRFRDVVLRSLELEYAYIQRSGVGSPSDLAASIQKLSIPVTVSGRYGKWDPQQLTVETSGSAGAPSFVHLPGIPSPSATPSS